MAYATLFSYEKHGKRGRRDCLGFVHYANAGRLGIEILYILHLDTIFIISTLCLGTVKTTVCEKVLNFKLPEAVRARPTKALLVRQLTLTSAIKQLLHPLDQSFYQMRTSGFREAIVGQEAKGASKA
jgi:hypothetical protein